MNGDFSGLRVLAVLAKEFKQLTRDRVTYAMILVLPIIQLLLFGYAINSEPRHLPTAVLIQEDSVFARSVVAALNNSLYFKFAAQARTPAELDDMLRRGDVQFAITIPGDFSRRLARGETPPTPPPPEAPWRPCPPCPPRPWPTI
jgi:ABC-2 type transport system permease protein